jgi:hypothetical protein
VQAPLGCPDVLKMTSVVDFRFTIEAIAALSQLTDREFHRVAICQKLKHFRARMSQFAKKCSNLQMIPRKLNDFSEFLWRIVAPTLRFAARLIIKQINNFLITNF